MKKLITFLLVGTLALGISLAMGQSNQVDAFASELKVMLLKDAVQTPTPLVQTHDWPWMKAGEAEKVFKEPLSPVYATHLPTDYYTPFVAKAPLYRPPLQSLGTYGNPVHVTQSSFGSFSDSYLQHAVTDIYRTSRTHER